MKTDHKYLLFYYLISCLFGIAIWVFFGVFYRHHLHYHEQLQLFQLGSDYFTEQIVKPGGLAIYLGGFITQFFYESSLGATILAVILVIQSWLLDDAIYRTTGKSSYKLLSLIPSLLMVIMLCNENIMLSLPAALLGAILAVYGYGRIPKTKIRMAFLLLMTPLLYWLIGMAVFVFTLSCLFIEWAKPEKKPSTVIIASLTAIALLFLCPVAGKMIWVQYPLKRLIFAGNYFRFVMYPPSSIIYVLLSPALIMVFIKWLPEAKKKTNLFLQAVQLGILILTGWWGVSTKANWQLEEFMGYDYYVRMERWNNIINYANQQSPESPLTVTALNLALSQRGYLPDYMFNYFQNGPEGLLPNYSIDFIASALLGEIYYHLGQVNSAQRYAFEAMEAIPDHQKSARCLKRLAETNIINGQYEIAYKYLDKLAHTYYYKDWAIDAMSYLGDENKINNHPEWGKFRSFRLQEDFLFYDEDREQLPLGLFNHNNSNTMAMDYLLAYYLLTKNMQRFLDCYGIAEEAGIFKSIPKSYQEALTLIWSNVGGNDNLPAGLDANMLQRLNSFMAILQSSSNPEPQLRREYGNTYWYYYYFRRNISTTQVPLVNPSIY